MTLDVEHLRLLDPGVTAGLVQHAVDEDYKHLGYVEREDTKTAVFAFLTVMKPGDLVLCQHAGAVRLGVVLGEPEHNEDNRRMWRKVRWFDDAHTTADLPRHVQRQLATPGIMVDVTKVVQALQSLVPAEAEPDDDDPATAAVEVVPVHEGFRPLSRDFADSLHMTSNRCRKSRSCWRKTGNWSCTARPGPVKPTWPSTSPRSLPRTGPTSG